MTPTELKEARAKLGLSQAGLAKSLSVAAIKKKIKKAPKHLDIIYRWYIL